MSIYGIGIDIVQIDRMDRSITNYGDRFIEKILHPNEQTIYHKTKQKNKYLAKRFAAKEAFAKALGTGIVEKITLPKIEVANDDQGKPYLVFHDSTQKEVEKRKITNIHLSISDEQSYAVAQVVLECNG